mmetsp:Transcript_35794/g.61579  ORF Transcript_35794/g.61579 Transcript_35794/m.61579 type:complete len:370 (-) Transcript_35794:37-1146(-)
MRGVALLPEELTRAQERSGVLELPAHHVTPLVEFHGEVAVTADPLGEKRVHDGLTGGADGNGLREIVLAALGDPGHLRSKSLNVVLLGHQGALTHEEREISVLHTELLDLGVKVLLNGLPNEVRPGAQHVAAGDVTVVNHFTHGDGLSVPVGEVIFLLRRQTKKSLLLDVLAISVSVSLLGGLGSLGRRLTTSRLGLCRLDRGEVDHSGLVVDVLQECHQVSRGNTRGAVVSEGVNVNQLRVQQGLVNNKLNLGGRVIYQSKGTDSATDHSKLFLQKILIAESDVGTRKVHQAGKILHIDVTISQDGKKEETMLLVAKEEVFSQGSRNASNELSLLLNSECCLMTGCLRVDFELCKEGAQLFVFFSHYK